MRKYLFPKTQTINATKRIIAETKKTVLQSHPYLIIWPGITNANIAPTLHAAPIFAPALIRRSSGIWLILFGLLFNGALRDGVESWVPTFLYKQFNTSPAFAATISVIVPIVSISGTYFSNWLNNKHIKNELYTAGWMFVIASLAVLGIYLTRNTNAIICVVFLSISVAAMWGSNHMFLTRLPYHFAKYGLSAAMTGAFNSIIYFASALAAGLYGILAARVGWDKLIIVWLIAGIGGTIFCFLSGRAWSKSRPSE